MNNLGNLKLIKDLGITALLAIMVVFFTFIILLVALLKGLLAMDVLLPILGGWVGTVLGAYFTLKAGKEANHRE